MTASYPIRDDKKILRKEYRHVTCQRKGDYQQTLQIVYKNITDHVLDLENGCVYTTDQKQLETYFVNGVVNCVV